MDGLQVAAPPVPVVVRLMGKFVRFAAEPPVGVPSEPPEINRVADAGMPVPLSA